MKKIFSCLDKYGVCLSLRWAEYCMGQKMPTISYCTVKYGKSKENFLFWHFLTKKYCCDMF